VDPRAGPGGAVALANVFNPGNTTTHAPALALPLYYAGVRPGDTLRVHWGGEPTAHATD
jgi:hypothetical protein